MNKKLVFAFVGLNILLIGAILTRNWSNITKTQQRKQRAEFKITKWPEERRLAEEKIKSRQLYDQTSGAVTIDLKPYVNAALTDNPSVPNAIKDNNLAELPLGTNIYGGVPFNVQGILQLTGRGMLEIQKNYPEKIQDIKIGRPCAKVHLLHASYWMNDQSKTGKTVAKIVVNYADGTSEELNIVSGKQVGDWWWPLMKSGFEMTLQLASDTEVAWFGSNPCIKRLSPTFSLVLFRTSLQNPCPEKVVTSFDYVSTLTEMAPFMVGLTVE